MKTTSLALVLSITLAAASGALAEDEAKGAQPATKEKTPSETKAVTTDQYVTGSYIKQRIRRDGQIAEGPNRLLVIDSKAIERSGATDLRQLLVRPGVVGR